MSDTPRLRGSSGAQLGPWPIGQIRTDVVLSIARQIVHHIAIGRADIAGNDFGDMFARAIKGEQGTSSLGLSDVASNRTSWSLKTVKSASPHTRKKVRLISGRNSPDFSFDIKNPHTDYAQTGAAVLSIWNSRLNKAKMDYQDFRLAVLVRNIQDQRFLLFEEELTRYATEDYKWRLNKTGNLEGFRKSDNQHCFTWQFSGGQFTIIRDVPGSATCFSILKDVPLLTKQRVEHAIDYSDDWIKIFPK